MADVEEPLRLVTEIRYGVALINAGHSEKAEDNFLVIRVQPERVEVDLLSKPWSAREFIAYLGHPISRKFRLAEMEWNSHKGAIAAVEEAERDVKRWNERQGQERQLALIAEGIPALPHRPVPQPVRSSGTEVPADGSFVVDLGRRTP